MPKRIVHKTLNFIDFHAQIIYVVLLISGALSIGLMALVLLHESHKTNDLVKENKARIVENNELIREQQSSRIRSCKLTYGSFILMFDPFFPPIEKMTPIQRHNWNTLLRTAKRLKRGCINQVKPRKELIQWRNIRP